MPGVLDAKLHRPEPVGLPRPRLLAPLVEEAGPGVVVVIAPPGSGKTTLLARAVALSPRRTAWYAAGPEDRTGPGFLEHLNRAVSIALGSDVGPAASAAELLAAVERKTRESLLLVLDDVHELEGGSAEAELSDLLRWRPQQLRIALGTRRPLAANTPRLMVSGELVELDHEALRFRSWEVEELFRGVYDERLTPEAAAALTRRTGGWAAGLMLFHLATAGKSDVERERAVAALGGRSRLFRSYLTRTVLDELDPERREFLLATCTLGTVTGALCDSLLEREGSAAVLEELVERQFFTTASADGRSYRYHQVMQTLLEGMLIDELGPRAAAEMHARSARLLESEGLYRDAVRAYAMAEDFASVARVLQRTGAGLAVDDRLIASVLPDDNPWLALVRARRLQRLGSFRESVAAFRHAETLFDDSDFRTRCADERAAAAVWLNEPPAPRGAPASLAESVRRATYRLPGQVTDTEPPLARAVTRLLAGEVAEARRELARVAGESAVERMFADLAIAVSELVDATAENIVSRLEEISLTAEVEEQPWLARFTRGLQGCVLLVVSPEPWRAESCASLIDECIRSGDDWGASLLSLALGVAHAARGDDAAIAWLDKAAAGAAALGAPVVQAWAETLGAATAKRRGDPDLEARSARATALSRSAGLRRVEPVLERLADVPRDPPEPHPPRAAAGARIRCLGTFRISVDGQALSLSPLRPLPHTLLLLLALNHGRAVHREILIDALWPDASVEAATHRLHAAASSLRRCLSDAGLQDVVRRHGSAYSLTIEEAVLDAAEFDGAIREAGRCGARGDKSGALDGLLVAIDLYQGDLLPEAGPAEWVVAERERLRAAAATAAYSAGVLSLSLRSPADALPAARRATELDPLRDSAWTLLAEVQERMGDLKSAAATRREHALIAAELNART